MQTIESLEPRRLFAAKPVALVASTSAVQPPPRQVENLGRGVVAVNKGSGQVFVSWRLLANDPDSISFNLYRSTNGAAAVKRATVTTTTNYTDTGVDATKSNSYFVRPVLNGVEQAASGSFTLAANAPAQQFQYLAFDKPADMTMPDGSTCTYSPNDASVGDVDGDGEYELIVKWDPSNSKDNSQSGYTGDVYVDAYELDGTRLWRIDLGKNIRAGAHYTQFIVYDLDGDGKAEVAMKTAPGTVDGTGKNVLMGSDKATADYRTSAGYILSGPEYLTLFNGQTGAAMASSRFVPQRVPGNDNPTPAQIKSVWGDDYGNRIDRFLAGVAYLDGVHPSLIMSRGYYTRAVISAWDWDGTTFSNRWTFDSDTAVNGSKYRGQGAHSMNVADVDGDGKDEIVFGACVIDDNGTGLYSTGFGHGDALHTGDFVPSNPGLETFMVHEDPGSYQGNGGTMIDAKTGKLLWSIPGTGDVGRGVSFDIDPRFPGSESWDSANSGIFKSDGTAISGATKPGTTNFSIYWDGDLSQETLDRTYIDKWNTTTQSEGRLLTLYQLAPISEDNGSKAVPMLSGDLFGDWREEVVFRASNGNGCYIFSTSTPTTYRRTTLMQDTQYRTAIAWQNVGYNQPPHLSYALGDGVIATPNVRYAADAAPTFVAGVVNDGAAQRSRVSTYTLTFGEAVTLVVSGLSVTRGDGTSVPFTVSTTDDKSYVLSFAGNGISDGVYTVNVLPDAVRDAAGNTLAGGAVSLKFHRLFGDLDGNRIVNNADHLAFKSIFGASSDMSAYDPNADYDGNGIVNNADYLQFKQRFGLSVVY